MLPPLTREGAEAALVTRLAYVVTGDAQVDAASKAGLTGLTQVLTPAPPWNRASPSAST